MTNVVSAAPAATVTATITVRFFAGAAAAAGSEEERLPLPADGTVDAVVASLSARSADLARVLAASSFLLDGVATRPGDALPAGATLDVLPPFAGG